MRKLAIIITALFAAATVTASAAAAEYEIREEYRQDVISYDEEAARFWRQNFSVKLNKITCAFLSHNYLQAAKQHIFTGYLNIAEPKDRGGVIAGNFNANFGSGLFFGTKRYVSGDPFVGKLFSVSGKFLSPSGSASPAYCLQGLGAYVNFGGDTIKFSAGVFASARKRYLRLDYFDEGKLPASITSLNGKIYKYGKYTEPVLIKDYGLCLQTVILSSLRAGLLLYGKNISAVNGNSIVWEYYENRNAEYGVTGSGGVAAYAIYSDKYVSIFCEGGVTIVNRHMEQTNIGDAYAFAAGIRLRYSKAALSLYFANAGDRFYAPEAADNVFATKEGRLSVLLKLTASLQIGGTASYEMKKFPGKTESALPAKNREGLYALFRHRPFEIKTSFDAAENKTATGNKRTLRELIAINYKASKKFSLDVKGSAQQKTGGGMSWSAGAGILVNPVPALSFGWNTTFYYIRGSGIYDIVLPSANALASGSYTGSTTASTVVRIALRYKGVGFSARYKQEHTLTTFGESRIELSGKAAF